MGTTEECFVLEAALRKTVVLQPPAFYLKSHINQTNMLGTAGLASLFNGLSTFVGYLMPKPPF